VGQEKNSSLHF